MKFKISSETPFRSHKQTDLEIALCCNAISAFTQTFMIALENNHTVVLIVRNMEMQNVSDLRFRSNQAFVKH